MSFRDHSGRLLAEGLDCKLPENTDALISYLASCRNVSLQCQPSVTEDGSLIVHVAPQDDIPASQVAKMLLERTHTVKSQVVRFSPLPSQLQYPYGFVHGDVWRETSRQGGRGAHRETRNVWPFGRGRGMWKPDQSASLNPTPSGSGYGSRVQSSDWQSLPGHAVRVSWYEGRRNEVPLPSSLYGMPADVTSGQLKSSTRPVTLSMGGDQVWFQAEKSIKPEITASHCDPVLKRQGLREGLDIIKVQGLPPQANQENLLVELRSRIKSSQPNLSCQCDLVHWDLGKGEALVQVKDLEAIFALWRNRHKSPLKCDGHDLSWDVAVPETYEDKRMLVKGLTQDITPCNLKLHIQNTGCLRDEVDIQQVIPLKGGSKALIDFEDTIVDAALVDTLNERGSDYEGAGEQYTHLTYSLVPVPRSLQLSGLDSTIDKGALRNYFGMFHRKVTVKRQLLVDHIKMSGGGLAIVQFRTVEDCQEVLGLPEVPVLGSKDHRPGVQLYSKYPFSGAVDPFPSNSQPCATSSPAKDSECVKAVKITPEDPVVFDYIFSNLKFAKRLRNVLNCDELDWDGSTLAIVKPSYEAKEYEKRLWDFADGFCCKQLLISDARLWQKSLNFAEHEVATRSSEGKLVHSEGELKILFVGLETEITPVHQHCGHIFSGWRQQLEEETEEIQDSVKFPSSDYVDLLQRSAIYESFVEVVEKQTGGKACLDLKGPRNRVRKTKEMLSEAIETIASVSVCMDSRIIKFLIAVGLRELNALYEKSNIAVVAVDCEESNVRLLIFPEARDAGTTLAKETYAVVPVNSAESEEVQGFIRSSEYNEFILPLCKEMVVMMDPSYEDIKASRKMVNLSVVGKTQDAAAAAKRLDSFFSEAVIYTEQRPLEHPGFTKFLTTFKCDELNKLKAGLTDVKGDIDIRQKKEVIVLRATKSGIGMLREKINNLLDGIEFDEQEVKKHGLARFLRSASFMSERSKIEKKKEAVVWIDGEDRDGDDDDEMGPNYDRGFVSFTATSKKLGEYLVRNSSNKRISLYTGDICRHNVDVIVNAANEELQHVGGLAKHVLECAGGSLQQDCNRYIHEHKKLPTGNAMYTSAGRLTFAKYVIHAVGPRWPSQAIDTVTIRKVEADLENAVKSSMVLANQLRCKTVAFPAISSGIYGCPADVVAQQIIRTASNFLTETLSTSLTEVHVVLREQETDKIRCFNERMKKDLDPVPKQATRLQSEIVQAHTTERLEAIGRSFSRSATQTIRVTVKPGDLSTEDSDVIVNSTNKSMNMDSALASKETSRKAGPNLQSECTTYITGNGTLPSGGTYTSGGYNLSCQHVVHVNCPNTPQGLAKAVEDCLKEASRLGVQSVSFPALGTGRMGVADVIAATAMFDGIEKFDSSGSSSISDVNIVIFDDPKLPVFQLEQTKRGGLDGADGEEIVSFSSVRLSNGTVVCVEQGDITADSSDVIVAPAGVVYSAVTRKSPQTNNDLSTLSAGTPNPVADLSAGGQLLCGRVYAISVPSRSPRSSDDECIRTIQNIVGRCLNLANASGYSSIAIPAIGTGGLGYSNKHTAAAIIEASKAFAAKFPLPSLSQIKISVFEAHRLSYFQQELQTRSLGRSGGFLQKVASGFRSFGNAVGGFFGSGQEPAKPKRKRKVWKSFSSGGEDLASVAVIASSRDTCQSVQSMLRGVVDEFCVSKSEDINKVPDGFDTNELTMLAARSGVSLKFDVKSGKEGTAKLTLSGFKDDVATVYTSVLQRLNKALEEEADAATKERILEQGRWFWQENDGSFKPYSDETTVKIETAREIGETTVKISNNGVEYEIDIPNQVQKARGRKDRPIKRENKLQQGLGTPLPVSWFDPTGVGKDYDAYMHKLRPSNREYMTVKLAFVTSGGGGTILSIERVQNPKLYRSYVQEKQHIQKRRQREINSGSVCLEVKAFHGTSENAVDQIVNNGFNRSYAGSAAGTNFGAGVYFAKAAQLSSGYSPSGTNMKRKMFYCDVLLGLTTVGHPTMLEPPVIDVTVSATDKYDSTVNNVASPTIYVSCYKDYMAYPTYLITFK